MHRILESVLCSREKEFSTLFLKVDFVRTRTQNLNMSTAKIPAQQGSPTDALQSINIYKFIKTTFDINVRLDALGHCAPLLANLLGQ